MTLKHDMLLSAYIYSATPNSINILVCNYYYYYWENYGAQEMYGNLIALLN